MPTILITGANRGLGLALARQCVAKGWRVHAASRSGTLPEALAAHAAQVVPHRLDVLDPGQIAALARALGDEPLDVLVNSAGTFDKVGGALGDGPPIPPEQVFAINSEAPINVAAALFRNLTLAPLGKMIFMSSAHGIRTGGRTLSVYGQSKAALNDAVRAHAEEWAYYGVIGIAFHPGWVSTDMGGARAPVTPEQSAAGTMMVIEGLTPDHCGAFIDYRGNFLPW